MGRRPFDLRSKAPRRAENTAGLRLDPPCANEFGMGGTSLESKDKQKGKRSRRLIIIAFIAPHL